MERVTFQDKSLVEKIKKSCVCTWRNIVPGFETASADECGHGDGALVLTCLTQSKPGTASQNIATIFAAADGRVLHIAPGILSPADFAKELDFALSVQAALEKAGKDRAASDHAFVLAHETRRDSLAKETALDPEWKTKLHDVHQGLACRVNETLETLKLSNYFEVTPDTDEVRKSGAEARKQILASSKR